jgi:hypothetical protein
MTVPDCDSKNDASRCLDTTADSAIGTLLVIITLVGVPANLTSCYLFFKEKTRNSNAKFFQRIYMVITAVDTFICGALFPTIQALLRGRRSDDLLFTRAPFCTLWYILWIVAQQETIFLVAMLSSSRLYLLRYPLKKLYVPAATAAPLLFGLIVLVVFGILPLGTGFSPVSYRAELAHCWLTDIQPKESLPATPGPDDTTVTQPPFDPFDTPEEDDIDFSRRMMIKTTIESFFYFLPVMPIMISLVFSLYYISQAMERQADSHKDRLVTAAGTVIIVTAVYVVFNLPTMVKGVYLTYIYAMSYHHLASNDSYLEFYRFAKVTYAGYGRYGWDYLWLCVYTVLPVFKSGLGPALYFWRIDSFRKSMMRLTNADKGGERVYTYKVTQVTQM